MLQVILSLVADFFDKAWWQQLVVTLAGLVIGIPFALWINRKQEKREEERERAKERTQKVQLLGALSRSVGKNRGLLDQMKRDLDSQVIFYNVDLSLLEELAGFEFKVLDDIDLCERLANLRYELSHLHQKVDLQLQIFFDGALRALSTQTPQGEVRTHLQLRSLLVGSIKAHLEPLLSTCDQVLAAIEKCKSPQTG